MLAPRLRALTRPSLAMATASQCIRQQPSKRWPGISIQEAITQQRRHRSGRRSGLFSGAAFSESARALWYRNPVSVTMAALFICAGFGSIIYANYYYQKYMINQFTKFPEEVSKKLRRAIYYSSIDVKPDLAMKYYKQALEVANEMGMDPFSDEILGVKLRIVKFMEEIQVYPKAIEILEIVHKSCLEWLDKYGDNHMTDGKRTRILAKSVQISTKLGELYANKYVDNEEASEERLVWAVETALKEQQRREKEGVKEGEGDWLGPEELGGAFEALGHNYEEKNQHYLATPLFLQAINLCPPTSCHSVILMNNLATSLAQQVPPATAGQPPLPRSVMVNNARQWAKKALAVASKIQEPERDEECDLGCAVASHNLGEFAEMDGKVLEARQWYEEARRLAKAVSFEEGVQNADEGLKRLANA